MDEGTGLKWYLMHAANESRGKDLTAFKKDLKLLLFLLHLNAAFLIILLERAEKRGEGYQNVSLFKVLSRRLGTVDIFTSSPLNVHWTFGSDTLVNRPTAPKQSYVRT